MTERRLWEGHRLTYSTTHRSGKASMLAVAFEMDRLQRLVLIRDDEEESDHGSQQQAD